MVGGFSAPALWLRRKARGNGHVRVDAHARGIAHSLFPKGLRKCAQNSMFAYHPPGGAAAGRGNHVGPMLRGYVCGDRRSVKESRRQAITNLQYIEDVLRDLGIPYQWTVA